MLATTFGVMQVACLSMRLQDSSIFGVQKLVKGKGRGTCEKALFCRLQAHLQLFAGFVSCCIMQCVSGSMPALCCVDPPALTAQDLCLE